MGFVARYITAAALLMAAAGGTWGWWQDRRAASIEADLMAARTEISRLQAEAAARETIDNAIDQVQRLDGSAISDWLRARAGTQ